jgi:hypothetical protein
MVNHHDLREASKQVLLAAMHDPHVPLIVRVDAAIQLLKSFPNDFDAEHEPWPGQVTVTIRIEGRPGNEVREAEDTWPLNHGPEVGHA